MDTEILTSLFECYWIIFRHRLFSEILVVLAIMFRGSSHIRLRAVWQNLVEDHGRNLQFEVALQDRLVMNLLVRRAAVASDHGEQVATANRVLVRRGPNILAVGDGRNILVDAALVLELDALVPEIA